MSKSDPHAARFQSLDQLFAVALAMEREAADRYQALAETTTAAGNAELSALFQRLRQEEIGHIDAVVDLGRRVTERASESAPVRWKTSEAYDAEQIEGDPVHLTSYQALSIAVLNEERAFAFYSYAAAYAENKDVKRAAEGFAQEELRHAALLRRHRRLAYHKERAAYRQQRRWPLAASSPRANEAFASTAAALEAAIGARLQALAEHLLSVNEHEPAAVLHRVAERTLKEAEALASAPVGKADGPALPTGDVDDVLGDAVLDLEELADFYLGIASRARDEDLLERSQHLAESAIARIALLRHWLVP